MLSSMLRPLLTLLCTLAVAAATVAPAMAAPRVLEARVERVDTAVAALHPGQVRPAWAADGDSGELSLQAGRVDAPGLGYRYRDLDGRRSVAGPGPRRAGRRVRC